MLGLPDTITACLFDLDGVLTKTATVHAHAWKAMFDDFLGELGQAPFVLPDEYDRHVDGKPRYDGVRSFLAARAIHADEQLIRTLADRKNDLVIAIMRRDGVQAYEGSVRYAQAARDAGLRRAVVSSSANAGEILAAAQIEHLFEAVIDGVVADRGTLEGKPAPDMFLAGASALQTPPSNAAVFEDALAGVEAGRAGSFGYVIGVDRSGQAQALSRHGADIVVADLAELLEDRP